MQPALIGNLVQISLVMSSVLVETMHRKGRIELMSALGEVIRTDLDSGKLDHEFEMAGIKNPWFTPDSCQLSFTHIANNWLEKDKLTNWLEAYKPPTNEKQVGLVLAGNIPLVGFHDVLTTFLSGHIALVKLSDKDTVLFEYIMSVLKELEPSILKKIQIVDKLAGFDAVIATGSNNTSRYFEYYFKEVPSLIRKSRYSIAVLDGSETEEQLTALSDDIFSYYGLGCRNISAILTPESYDHAHLLSHFEKWDGIQNHHKYRNNYDYYKSIFLLNKVDHLDTGFLLVKKDSEEFTTPISVLNMASYTGESQLTALVEQYHNDIQCIVGKPSIKNIQTVGFGQTQFPILTEYADGVDTLKFLSELI